MEKGQGSTEKEDGSRAPIMRPRGRRPEFHIEPTLERSEGSKPSVERGIDQAKTDQREQHVQRSPRIKNNMGADLVLPGRWDFGYRKPAPLQRIEKVNVKGKVGEFEVVMD